MNPKIFLTLVCLSIILASCASAVTPTEQPAAEIANPASVYCEENGGKLEIRADADGNQYGVCTFPDGSECDEWAYFRGECAPFAPSA